jgi:hypothetical protein
MHAQFITCRPSLPLGYKAGDLPLIQRPLHSDEAIEAYLLDRTTDSDLVLVRSSEQNKKHPRMVAHSGPQCRNGTCG